MSKNTGMLVCPAEYTGFQNIWKPNYALSNRSLKQEINFNFFTPAKEINRSSTRPPPPIINTSVSDTSKGAA